MSDKTKNEEMLFGQIAIMALLNLARVDKRLTAQAVVVLQALGSKVGKQTMSYRTATAIAREMGCSHTAINKQIKRLLEYEYITRKKQQKHGFNNVYIYYFNIQMAAKYKDNLIEYRKKTEVFKRHETLNGFRGKKPSKVSEAETSNGFIKKDIEIIKKKKAPQGVVDLSSATNGILEQMIKRGSF